MLDIDPRLTNFLASAPDPTLIVDGQGSILFASAQIQAVFGYVPKEIIGARIETLMPERFRPNHTSLFNAYFSAPSPRPMGAGFDLYAQRKDGSEFPVEISLSPLKDQKSLYVLCAIRDVSERHTMEADLRATATRLDIARAEAERANAVKSRFLAAASHDLRQPLQAASLYLSLLTKQAASEDQAELCAKLRVPLQAMSGILNALLDISMLDSGSVAPKRSDFALAAVLDRIAANLRPLAQQKNLRFDCPMTSIFVNSDPALLERIVENLVSNAVRYTTDGSVTIYAEQIGGVVRLSVADTGIGIPKEALDKIFEEYFQYDNPARNIKKGLGLGLAIVKRLSDLLMHPIQVSSVLGEGSIFAVDVPLATAAALTEGSKATATPAQDVRKLAVLFIDDDMAVADSLSMVLRGAGLQAVSASDGDGAVKRCADGFLPDVVLSDYRMPNENGLIVVDRVRRSLGFDVPVIMMTGDTSLRHIQEQNVENLTVVQKPVDPDALIELIHEMARRRGGARTTPNA